MKKFLIGILAIISVTSEAQDIPWHFSEVKNTNDITVGYIYHTHAIGKVNNSNKIAAGLKYVCTNNINFAEPIIVISWNGLPAGIDSQQIVTAIDGKIISTDMWSKHDNLYYITASTIKNIINGMKTGKKIEFRWIDNSNSRYRVIFDLNNFNTEIDKFNSVCGL